MAIKAEIVEIRTVTKHPNADRLDLLTFNNYDWIVVTGRENPEVPRYHPGDLVIYIPIDSILPEPLETYLFPPDSKITLSNHRVRSIKIRKCVSQGMAIDITPELQKLFPKLPQVSVPGLDVTTALGITKYEPPEPGFSQGRPATSKKKSNPHFKEYTDIDNFKYFPDLFEGKQVYISEKLHGTSARYAYLPVEARTIVQRILKFFRLLPAYEFCYGSRRVQLQDKKQIGKIFYDSNVYAKIASQYKLRDLLCLHPGYAIYGEIIGSGIQGGYEYGHKNGEHSFYVYDVSKDGKFLPYNDLRDFCERHNLTLPPYEFAGIFNKEQANKLRTGLSAIGGQKVKEGIVIKDLFESHNPLTGRSVLKFINDDYLLKEQTEWH